MIPPHTTQGGERLREPFPACWCRPEVVFVRDPDDGTPVSVAVHDAGWAKVAWANQQGHPPA